jgi:hypothetical protein
MRKLKSLYYLFKFWCNYLNSHLSKSNFSPDVHLVLHDPRMEVYYYPIIISLLEGGYRITLYLTIKCQSGYVNWFTKLLYNKNIRLSLIKTTKNKYIRIISDKNIQYGNVCFLDPDYYKIQIGSLLLPFPLHPNHYASCFYRQILSYNKDSLRRYKILFSGNTDKSLYNTPRINNSFDILNRWEIINYLRNTFPPKNVIIVRDHQILKSNNSDLSNSLVLCDWEWNAKRSRDLKARIPNENWFSELSMADFFIALPGVKIPFSHNCIEAMAVGSIPILNYAHLFSPKLIDGINCLVFKSYEDLHNRIMQALQMSHHEISFMRKNVTDYYNSYLSSNRINQFLLNRENTRVYFYHEVDI